MAPRYAQAPLSPHGASESGMTGKTSADAERNPKVECGDERWPSAQEVASGTSLPSARRRFLRNGAALVVSFAFSRTRVRNKIPRPPVPGRGGHPWRRLRWMFSGHIRWIAPNLHQPGGSEPGARRLPAIAAAGEWHSSRTSHVVRAGDTANPRTTAEPAAVGCPRRSDIRRAGRNRAATRFSIWARNN